MAKSRTGKKSGKKGSAGDVVEKPSAELQNEQVVLSDNLEDLADDSPRGENAENETPNLEPVAEEEESGSSEEEEEVESVDESLAALIEDVKVKAQAAPKPQKAPAKERSVSPIVDKSNDDNDEAAAPVKAPGAPKTKKPTKASSVDKDHVTKRRGAAGGPPAKKIRSESDNSGNDASEEEEALEAPVVVVQAPKERPTKAASVAKEKVDEVAKRAAPAEVVKKSAAKARSVSPNLDVSDGDSDEGEAAGAPKTKKSTNVTKRRGAAGGPPAKKVRSDSDNNDASEEDEDLEAPVKAPKTTKAPSVEVVKKAPAKAKSGPNKKATAKIANVDEDKVEFHKRGGVAQKKKRSLSNRAGLTFPVARIRKNLKKSTSKKLRIQVGAAVYFASTIEYLVAEMLELGMKVAQSAKKVRITPRHLLVAIKQDEELDQLLQHVTIASGGVFKTVHPALLPDSRAKKMDTN